jgi:hypothetical protein
MSGSAASWALRSAHKVVEDSTTIYKTYDNRRTTHGAGISSGIVSGRIDAGGEERRPTVLVGKSQRYLKLTRL